MTGRTRAAAIVFVLGLAACGQGSGADKAGGSDPVVTLQMGTLDGPGNLGADEVAEFGRRVDELSEGAMKVKPVYNAFGSAAHEQDQAIARRVQSGDLDMALVAARAWDTEGVQSLRVLHAPFLVNNEELLRQVVMGALGSEMLGGIGDAGVYGLALLPEPSGLRHPFGFERALLSPNDYEGMTIRAPRSDVVYTALRELGASPKDLNLAEFRVAAADGSVAGAESSFDLAEDFPLSSIATGNVTLYAKTDSLVINADVFEGLSDDQQDVLREAAERTRDWAVDNMISDAEAARRYCDAGGSVRLASTSDMRALERAVGSVYAEMEKDPETRKLIDEIQSLKAELPAASDSVEPCGAG